MIFLSKGTILTTDITLPPLYRHRLSLMLKHAQGTLLPNRDLLLSGGLASYGDYDTVPSETKYLRYRNRTNEWIEVGRMIIPRYHHASVFINGIMFSSGGCESFSYPSKNIVCHHEAFSIDGVVKEIKEMPIALYGHTATKIDNNRYLVTGGRVIEVSSKTNKTMLFQV